MSQQELFKYDISRPVSSIVCTPEIYKHIIREPLFVPRNKLPQQALYKNRKELSKFQGLLYKNDVEQLYVLLEEDSRFIRDLTNKPFPSILLDRLIPGYLKGSVWCENIAWGDLIPAEDYSMLFLTTFDNNVADCCITSSSYAPDECSSLETAREVDGLIELMTQKQY